MAEYSSVARPYARALFELGREAGDQDRWAELLEALEAVVESEELRPALTSPLVPADRLADALLEGLGDLDEPQRNFIRLLARRRRLVTVAEIRRQYEHRRAEDEGRMTVELRTARPLDEASRKRLAEQLGKQLNRKLELEEVEDEGLIGGVLVRAGDLVIDGSVKGQLDRLQAAMNQ